MSLFGEIKTLYENHFKATPSKEKFFEAKFIDGTIIKTDSEAFKVGDKVQIQDEKGGYVDAPVGEHELQDGTVLVIDKESVLTEVRPPADAKAEENLQEATPAAKPEVLEDTPSDAPADETATPSIEDRVAKLEEMIASIMQTLEGLQGNVGEMTKVVTAMGTVKAENEVLKTENQKLSKAPAATPVATKKFEKTESPKASTIQERVVRLWENNIKK
jgi:regulator of replication initiation timing